MSIGDCAFSDCSSLKSVTCYAITPPQMGSAVFGKVDCSKIPLYVLEESIEAYQTTEQWKEFYPITAIKTVSINVINANPNRHKFIRDNQVLIQHGDKLYTLQGQEVK